MSGQGHGMRDSRDMTDIPTPQTWARLSALFDDSRDFSAIELQAWLVQLPPHDQELLPWLRQMLAAHATADPGDWLDRGPVLPVSAALGMPPGLEPGAHIGPWVLHELLGSGGMATVWRATRADALPATEVALKLPLLRRAGSDFSKNLTERFALERDILARLVHPHITPLLAAGVTTDGTPWLAMQRVQGVPLPQWCDQHRLGVRERLALFAQVLGAVQYAHGQLVIHRDLKPNNILVTPQGQIRLLDFGIAKLLSDDGISPASEMTQSLGRVMTLAYAAPEQLLMQPLGTATDVYALGVVLFELLSGQRPYVQKQDTAAQTEQAITEGNLRLASSAVNDSTGEAAAQARGSRRRRLSALLRGDLDTVLAKALQREPTHRYATVAEFADDLQRWLAGQPVRAQPSSAAYRFKRYVLRHRVPVAAGVVALLALVAALGVSLVQVQRADRERDRALTAQANTRAVNGLMNDLLNDAARTGKPIKVGDLLARAEIMARSQFAHAPDQLAQLLFSLSLGDQAWVGQARSLKLSGEALALAKDPTLRDNIEVETARLVAHGHDLAAGRARLLALTARSGVDAEVRGAAFTYLGELDYLDGRAQDALRWQEQAVQAFQAAPDFAAYRMAAQLSRLAFMKTGTGEARAGDTLFTQAFALLQSSGRERGTVAVAMRNERASAFLQTGDPRRAAPLLEANLQVLEVDMPGSPQWLYGVRGLALAQWSQGQHAAALALLERGLASTGAARAGRAASDPVEPTSDLEHVMTCDRSFVLSRLGRFAEAALAFKAAAVLRQRPGNFSKFYETSCALALAEHHLLAGRQALAREQLDALLMALSAQAIGPTATALTLRALARAELGDGAGALNDGARALAMTRPGQGDAPYSSRTGRCLMVMAVAQHALGNAAAARATAQGAITQLEATVDASHPWLLQLRALAQPR